MSHFLMIASSWIRSLIQLGIDFTSYFRKNRTFMQSDQDNEKLANGRLHTEV